MDLDKIVEVVVGTAVGWFLLIEVRLHQMQNKLIRSQEKTSDDKIDAETRILTDDQLESLVRKDIGPGDKL